LAFRLVEEQEVGQEGDMVQVEEAEEAVEEDQDMVEEPHTKVHMVVMKAAGMVKEVVAAKAVAMVDMHLEKDLAIALLFNILL
ncbi:hypothetical protein, partial [Escherichia coli]|uniref:hypothetical protein n=1 Tax=Escherichia coli TaxID=562 RepID=UPI0020C07E40